MKLGRVIDKSGILTNVKSGGRTVTYSKELAEKISKAKTKRYFDVYSIKGDLEEKAISIKDIKSKYKYKNTLKAVKEKLLSKSINKIIVNTGDSIDYIKAKYNLV